MLQSFILIAVIAATLLAATSLQVEPSKPPRLYRVILPVSDIERAAQFYAELLELKGVRVSPGRQYFHTGETILAVVDPRADGDDFDARSNSDHVYFAVEDLERAHQRASSLGGLSEEMGAIAKRPWGEVSFYMEDPFGNPLCFVDERTVFTGGEG